MNYKEILYKKGEEIIIVDKDGGIIGSGILATTIKCIICTPNKTYNKWNTFKHNIKFKRIINYGGKKNV